MRLFTKVIVVTAVAFSLPLSLRAQESPTGFFSKEFARTPAANSNINNSKKAKLVPRSSQSKFEMKDPRAGWDTRKQAAESLPDSAVEIKAIVKPADIVSKSGEEEGVMSDNSLEVLTIGAIINFSDPTHFKQSIKELTDVAIENDLSVGTIYTVGLPFGKSDYAGLIKPLLVRGAMLRLRGTPPEEYNVKLSPAWLIDTTEGTYVLEGVRPLRKFFNSRGRFVDRSKDEIYGNMQVVLDKTKDAKTAEHSKGISAKASAITPDKSTASAALAAKKSGEVRAMLKSRAAELKKSKSLNK